MWNMRWRRHPADNPLTENPNGLTITPSSTVWLQLPDLHSNLYFGIYLIKPALSYLPAGAKH